MTSPGALSGKKLARVLSSFLVVGLLVSASQTLLAGNRRSRFNFAPSITTQPVSQTIIAGQSASFSVAVTGTAPFSYQWKKNGTSILGATSSTYTTPPETVSKSGSQFTVSVGNSAGRATSSPATLTVIAPPTVSPTVTSNTGSTGPTSTSNTTTPSSTTTITSVTSPPPTGTSTLVLTPNSLSLGSVTIGASNTLTATLVNSGTASASITNVSISGAGFSVSGVPVGQTLAPSQSVALNVVFAPSAAGSVSGNVTVTSTASNSSVALAFSGTGVQPVVSHSASLSWSPSTSAVNGYNIYRSTISGGSYSMLNSSLIGATNYVDSGVQSGSTYYYVATAVDPNNVESPYSNEISVIVP